MVVIGFLYLNLLNKIMKNLVLIVAVTNIKATNLSHFTPEIRLEQLRKTVDSIRERIPNSYIVITEGSTLTPIQNKEILEYDIDELILRSTDITTTKSLGEIILILEYLDSASHKELLNKHEIKNFAKISGRYELTERFLFNDENIVIKVVDPSKTWSGKGVCETRFYKFPYYMIDSYKEKMDLIVKNGIETDIEHSFYEYSVVPYDASTDEIGLIGYLSPTGELVKD